MVSLCCTSMGVVLTIRPLLETWLHGLLLRRELGRHFGLRLRLGLAFRPLGLRTGSTSSLRVSGPAFLPLTATVIVSSVVGITVSAPLLFPCNRALSVRNLWATTGHAPRAITAIMLRVNEALAVFAQRDVKLRTLLTRGPRTTVNMKCGVGNLSLQGRDRGATSEAATPTEPEFREFRALP